MSDGIEGIIAAQGGDKMDIDSLRELREKIETGKKFGFPMEPRRYDADLEELDIIKEQVGTLLIDLKRNPDKYIHPYSLEGIEAAKSDAKVVLYHVGNTSAYILLQKKSISSR
ncbi:MAG: hypothetical protein AABX51_01120 [Nanoarchaeota archaeon]